MSRNTTESSSLDSRGTPRSTSAPDAVQQVRERGAGVVIDVRTPIEVRAERIEGARHIPLAELASRIHEVKDIAGPGLLLCQSGKRAESARQTLARAGLDDLIVIEGGLTAYAAAGGEIVEDRQRMSLERQVRISAGLLVVIGTVLGFLVHPALHGVSAFVGAGLIFAGITDYCGMGLLLAKMPWNRS